MSINIDTSVKNQGQAPAIITGLDANKPKAGQIGRLYYATNTNIIYIDNGYLWVVFINGGASSGTINVATTFVPYASTTNNLVNSIIKQLFGNILINQSINNGHGILQVTGGINSDVFTAYNNLISNDVLINPNLINFNSNGGDTYSQLSATSFNIYDNLGDYILTLLATYIQFNDNGTTALSQLNFNDLTIKNDSVNEISKLTRYYLQIGPSGSGNANVSLISRSLTYSPVLGKSAYYNFDNLKIQNTNSGFYSNLTENLLKISNILNNNYISVSNNLILVFDNINGITTIQPNLTKIDYNAQSFEVNNSSIRLLTDGVSDVFTATASGVITSKLSYTYAQNAASIDLSIGFVFNINSNIERGRIQYTGGNLSFGSSVTGTYTRSFGINLPYVFLTLYGNPIANVLVQVVSITSTQLTFKITNLSTVTNIPSGTIFFNYLFIY